jgi:hypothetical protein
LALELAICGGQAIACGATGISSRIGLQFASRRFYFMPSFTALQPFARGILDSRPIHFARNCLSAAAAQDLPAIPTGAQHQKEAYKLLAGGTVMAEFSLVINEQERNELLRLLKNSLGETRVEVHRTHTPGYREDVKHEEQVIRNLLEKIQRLDA